MKKFRILLLLSLFAVLMTVFGNSFAQETEKPGIQIKDVVPDESFVILTHNFPLSTKYTVSLGDPENLENYTPVSRFTTSDKARPNSIRIPINDRFKGMNVIVVKLEDEQGTIILSEFTNIAEEPAAEEPTAEEPTVEETAEETTGETTEEPAPAPEEEIKLVNEEPEAQTEPEGEEIKLVNEEPEGETTVPEEQTEPETPAETTEPEPEVTEPEAPAETTEPEAETAEPKPEVTEPAEDPKAEETVPEETTEEIPVLVCNYAIIPTVHIDAVTRDSSVTFTTYNFPANSTFSVAMGTYSASWTPAPMGHPGYRPSGHTHHEPSHGVYVNPDVYADWPTFTVIGSTEPAYVPGFPPTEKPSHGPAPRPGVISTPSFSGVDAGSFETGDGSSQTLTFTIPESIKGTNPIAIWISDQGPCGFYSYNYFYNNSTH